MAANRSDLDPEADPLTGDARMFVIALHSAAGTAFVAGFDDLAVNRLSESRKFGSMGEAAAYLAGRPALVVAQRPEILAVAEAEDRFGPTAIGDPLAGLMARLAGDGHLDDDASGAPGHVPGASDLP